MEDDIEGLARGRDHTVENSARPGLSLLLKRAEHAVRARLDPFLISAGLSFEEWRILSVIADQPGLRMTDIGAAAVVPRASMTRHMDKLVERALVVRRIDAEDKRRTVSALSALGVDLIRQIRAEEGRIEETLADDSSLAGCRDWLWQVAEGQLADG